MVSAFSSCALGKDIRKPNIVMDKYLGSFSSGRTFLGILKSTKGARQCTGHGRLLCNVQNHSIVIVIVVSVAMGRHDTATWVWVCGSGIVVVSVAVLVVLMVAVSTRSHFDRFGFSENAAKKEAMLDSSDLIYWG